MPDPDKLESFIAADCGSVNTKVGLVDKVAGEFRFVGCGTTATTTEPPTADVGTGIRRGLGRIEARTNRRFLTEDGQVITPERASGHGVDGFVAVTSAALPLRVAIVGLSREVSVASATRSVNGTFATVEATLALDETGGRWLRTNGPSSASVGGAAVAEDASRPMGPLQDPAVVAAEGLARVRPDAIVLVGGIDGGATTALYEIANLVAAIAASFEENVRPVVIFAGNRDARPQIATRVGQVAALNVVDNVHPALERENPGALQRELEALYVERKIKRMPGIGALTSWTQAPIVPTAAAFETVVRYLSRRYSLHVLGADLGACATTVVSANGESFTRMVRADLGMGHHVQNVVSQVGVDRLMQWLPFELREDDLLARYLNHSLRPMEVPITRRDARILQSAARESLSLTARPALANGSAADLILLTGGLARCSDWGALALVLLDALQPIGVFTLAADPFGLAPAFGALASLSSEAAAGVLDRDGFVTLGTVIAPSSTNREGQVDLRVLVRPAGGGSISLEVPHGSLEVVPLALGQKAALQVYVSAGAELASARHGVYKAEVEGGTLGLVIDARGRPITIPAIPERRRAKVQEWLWEAGS